MIQAVIFDCFGVIADENWKPYLRGLLADTDPRLEEALSLNQEVDAGNMAYEDFLARLSDITDVPISLIRAKIETHTADVSLLDYIALELKGKYKIGLLSNVPANWLDKFLTPEQRALFDVVILSYEVGVAKPDPRIYQVMANRLKLVPEACLFVDDQLVNCEGALSAGMHTALFTGFDRLKSELRGLLQ